MRNILAVTGLTGKSGSVFAEQLAQNADEWKDKYPGGLRIFVRPTSDTRRLEELLPDAEIFRGDLTDTEFLKKRFTNVDTVVHIAGIQWSREVTEAAAFNKIRRIILVHTTGIYSKYKEAGEGYRQTDEYVYNTCKQNDMLVTILRPTMIYGSLKDSNVIIFIRMVDRMPVMPVVNHARYALQPVHFSDLGKAYYQVLTHEEETSNKDFILSGGAPIDLRDMLLEIGKHLGKKVRFISVPFPIAYAGAVVIYGITFKKIDMREKVRRLCEPRVFSHDEATEAFGYDPMDFKSAIKDEVNLYTERKAK